MLSQRGNFLKYRQKSKEKTDILLVQHTRPKGFDLGQKNSNYFMLLYL
jgi:hypothetical protein